MKRRLKVSKLAMVRGDEPSSVKKDPNLDPWVTEVVNKFIGQ